MQISSRPKDIKKRKEQKESGENGIVTRNGKNLFKETRWAIGETAEIETKKSEAYNSPQ